MTPKQILQAARDLITPPERWTTGWYARDKDGAETDSKSPDAVCWCTLGAVNKFSPDIHQELEENEALRVLMVAMKTPWPSRFNDTHTHAEVLAAFDAAIASLED